MPGSVNLGTVTAYVRLDTSGLKKGIVESQSSMQKFASSLGTTTTQLAKNIGRDMQIAGAAIAAGLGLATKQAADFDQAMRNVNSLVRDSEGQFQATKKAVMGLVDDPLIRQGPVDLAKGMYDVVSSGFQGQKALEILRISAIGAGAGMTDTATASRALMAVLNSGIGGVNSVRGAMDVLFRAVDRGVFTFGNLADNLGTILPTAKQMGVTIQEVAAAYATMTKQGLSLAESETALNNLMIHVAKPGKEQKKLMDELGISYGITAMEAKGLGGWLQEVLEKTHGNRQKIVELVPELRGMKGELLLLNNDLKMYNEELGFAKTATDGVGGTLLAAQEQAKGAKAQWEKMRAELELLGIEIGNTLLPYLTSLIGKVGEVIKVFSGQSEAAKTLEVRIAGVSAIALIAGGALVTLAARVLELRTAFVAAGLTTSSFFASLATGAAAIARIANPLTATLSLLFGSESPAAAQTLTLQQQFPKPGDRLKELIRRRNEAASQLKVLQSPLIKPEPADQDITGLAGLDETLRALGFGKPNLKTGEALNIQEEKIKSLDKLIGGLKREIDLAKAASDLAKAAKNTGGGANTKENKDADERKKRIQEIRADLIEVELGPNARAQYEAALQKFEDSKLVGHKLAEQEFDAKMEEIIHKMIQQRGEAMNEEWKKTAELSAKARAEYVQQFTGLLNREISETLEHPENLTLIQEQMRAFGASLHDELVQGLSAEKEDPLNKWMTAEAGKIEDFIGQINEVVEDFTHPYKYEPELQPINKKAAREAKLQAQEIRDILTNSFANAFDGMFQHGLKGFKGFFNSVLQGFERMVAQMAAKWAAEQIIFGALKLGAFFGFDDPVNDTMAFRWGRDFGRFFGKGALEGASRLAVSPAGASGGNTTVVNVSGPFHIREEADIDRLAQKLAWHTERRSRVRL